MALLFKCPAYVRDILYSLDLLGYGTLEECANAIISDANYSDLYDIADKTHIEIVDNWRISVITNDL